MTDRQRDQRARERRESAAWRRRIRRQWELSTDAEREAGARWYADAERAARAIARVAPPGIGPKRAAALIAALSPRTKWAENVASADAAARAAERASRDGLFGAELAIEGAVWAATESHGLTDPRRKAIRILQGENPADVLGGPKVRAFFANITGDHRAVTVDVWASRVATGDWDTPPTGRAYERLADAYRAVADDLGIPPRELQAAVWVAIRGSAD